MFIRQYMYVYRMVQRIMFKCSKEKTLTETPLWYKSPFISIYIFF